MVEQSKVLLIAQLDAAREGLRHSAGQLREDLDVPRHLKSTFVNHKSAWIGGAAVLGWVLAKLPGRKKNLIAHEAQRHNGFHGVSPSAKKYAISGILLAILRVALNALRPTLTAIASRKIKDMAAQRIRW